MRVPDRTPGLLPAFYVYNDSGSGTSKHEIDFEMPHSPSHGIDLSTLWLNVWNGSSLSDDQCKQHVTDPGWGEWHTYRIQWNSSGEKWFVGGTLVRTIPRADLPTIIPDPSSKLTIHFNIWAPYSDWTIGDAGLKPGAPHHFDVKSVSVWYLPRAKGRKPARGKHGRKRG